MSHLLNRSRQINFQCIARGATLKIEKKKEKKTVICCQQNFWNLFANKVKQNSYYKFVEKIETVFFLFFFFRSKK